MKELMMIAAATALLIGAGEVAVHRFDDRALFVPSPDAVAECFVRETMTRRFSRAASYLADGHSSERDIQTIADTVESRLGRVDDVHTETISSNEKEALVSVRLRSAKGREILAVRTVFQRGAWKVAGVR